MAVERLLGATALATIDTEEAIGGVAKKLGWNFATSASGKSIVAGWVRMTSAGTFVAGTKWQVWERASPTSASVLKLNIELGGLTGASGAEIEVPAFTPYPIGATVQHLVNIFHPTTQGGNNWYEEGFGNPSGATLSGNCIYYDTPPTTVDTPPQFEGFTNGAFAVDVGIDDTVTAYTDSAGLTDTQALTRTAVLTDSAGLTDTLTMARAVVLTDSAGLTDTAGLARLAVSTDTAGLTDTAVVARSMVPTDSAGLTDSHAIARTTAPTDSAGLTDTSSLALLAILTDSAGLTDTSAVQAAKLVTATDSAGLTDTNALTRTLVLTDSAGLTDAHALAREAVHTDTTGLTDTTAVLATRAITATDAAGLTDSAAYQLAAGVTATDSAGLTDTHAKARSAAVTDSAGLTDTTSLGIGLARTDSAGLTDSYSVSVARVLTDSAGLTDSATAVNIKSAGATDSAGLTDGAITQTGTATIFLPAGLVPIRALSAAEILTGNRSTRFRYDLYSKTEAALGVLDGVTKGKVDFTANASVHSGGAIDVTDYGQTVDWLNDRVRPVAIIEGLPEIPLGMYLFPEAPEEWDDTGRVWSVKLLDKTSILDQDKVDGTYSLDAGTVITTAAVALIASTGETSIAVTPSAATLSAPLAWETGTSKLRIVNDLLAVAGYFSLFCDGNGQFRGEPYVRPANRPIRYEFLDGQESIYSPEFVKDVDLYSIPNKFVATGQGSGGTEALTSVATNTDPDSPYSFAARGRWIVASATGVEAASQAVLDAYARRRLIELTSPTSSIVIAHALVPHLTFNNAVRLRRVPAGVDARHVVTKMTIELSPTALVKSTLQEVVDL